MKKNFLLLFCVGSISLYAAPTVTTSANLGPGSFSQAVLDVTGAGTIDFAIEDDNYTILMNGNQAFGSSFTIDQNDPLSNIVTLATSNSSTLDIGAPSPITTTFNCDSGQTLDISMGITGVNTTGITKTGTGILSLGADNIYFHGDISLSGGQITVSDANSLGTGHLAMATGTTLSLDPLTIANYVAITGTGDVEVGIGTATMSGIVSGTGTLRKQGSGTLVLSGVNTHAGGTILSGGQITLNSDTGVGLGSGVFSMDINTTLLIADTLVVGNYVGINSSGTATVEVASTDSATLTSIISGGGLQKTGTGTLVLSGVNEYTGGTDLAAGQITAANNNAFGSGQVTLGSNSSIGLDDGIVVGNAIELPNDSAIIVDTYNEGTLSGVISGAGRLLATSPGTLVLSGKNTINSVWIVNGQITIDHNSALGLNALTMSDGTTLVIRDGIVAQNNITMQLGDDSVTFEVETGATGTLSGEIGTTTGTALKTGAGELVLSGTNLYTGIFGVNAGTCAVNGSLAGGATVASGATLKGTGTVNGAVTVDTGGEITPGNSIGTITVASLTLNAGTTTNIEFSPSATSLIDVTGAAALAGTLNLTQNAGSYGASGSYEILTSTGRTGTFDTITGGLSGFTFSLTYDDDNVQLLYINTAPPVSSSISTDGLWGNVLKFADYLNADAPASSEYEALAALTGDAIFDGVNRASPARNAFGTYTSQQTVLSLSNILSNYLGSKRFFQEYSVSKGVAGKNLPYESELFAAYAAKNNQFDYKREEKKSSMWGSAFVDFAYQDQESQNVAFNFISEGALLGYDYQIDEKNAVGGVISYAHSQIDDKGAMGRSEISYYVAALYANYMKDNFYVEGAFWGVFNQIYTVRNIAFGAIDTKATSNQNAGRSTRI